MSYKYKTPDFKVGDKVYCFKTLKSEHNPNTKTIDLIFKQGETYEIVSMLKYEYTINSPYFGDLSLGCPDLPHVRFGFQFEDWFLSKKELRKRKLNAI